MLDYGLSNATFEAPNHGFAQIEVVLMVGGFPSGKTPTKI